MSEEWPYASSRLFIVEEPDTPGFPDGYLLAHFASRKLSLADLWAEDAGVFLFLRARSADLDVPALEAKLRQFLLDPLNRQVRFLWIENPAEGVALWRSHSLSVDRVDSLDGAPGARRISRLAYVDLRNYSLSIGAGTTIELDDAGDPAGFVLTRAAQGGVEGFELAAGFGAHRFHELGDTLRLPMAGELAGCLHFDFHVERAGEQSGTFGYPALAQLDVGFRVFFRDPDFPESGDKLSIASHRYPLVQEQSRDDQGFALYPERIGFRISLDPLHPLLAARTWWAFQPVTGPASATGFPSAYRTNRGYSVHLLPVGDESRLQFAPRPALLDPAEQATAPLYLVPAGNYGLQVPNYETGGLEPVADVVCGISGVEYVKISHDESTRLTFVPHQPAFAHAFVSVASLLRDLVAILESYSETGVQLDPDNPDLDVPIEDTGQDDGALGITDQDRAKILERVRQDYFPPGHRFTVAQKEIYGNLEIVEDLIVWLRKALQTVTLEANANAGDPALAAYPETSWAYVREAAGVVYHAQPDQAVLYKADASDTDFLDYLEVPSVGLPDSLTEAQADALSRTTGVAALAFPMLPYGHVDPAQLTDVRQLEIALLNGYRRDRIHRIGAATDFATSLKAAGDTRPVGTTPQGLIATFSEDCETLELLQLAKDTKNYLIPFARITQGSPLKAAIQSNQLFMVVTDPEAIRPYFDDDVLASVTGATNSLDIQDWGFELGPDNWQIQGTIFLFKFHDRPLIELARDPAAWSLAGELNQDPGKASRSLVRLLEEAVDAVATGDPRVQRKYAVLDRAARQANWTGILALNVHVPLGNLPDALKALAAGIDPDSFYAQYVGVEVTQVTSDGQELTPQQSSLFGLIDYANPNVPLSDPSGYNFHVPKLTIVFQNSQIADFAAEVLLVMDRLFDEATSLLASPDGRNILRLAGVAEEHNGRVTYSFGFSGANRFELSGKALQEVEIVKAQFATDPFDDPDADPLPVTGRFVLWARIRFVYQDAFDVLSFGRAPDAPIPGPLELEAEPPPPDYLSGSNLQIVMSFDLNQVDNQVEDLAFEPNPYQMAFDLERSGARSQSLFEKFPLKLSGLRYVADDAEALSRSGFIPVSTPVDAPELGSRWYGLTYELNLGSAGALAGSAGIVVSILVAWVPEEDGVFVGLKLPGSVGGKKEITVQGLLKISFKSIRFVVYPLQADDPEARTPDGERAVGYLLKIKNIVLKFFVLSFPPSGQTEIILFGDPREIDREDKLVGWYAAYAR